MTTSYIDIITDAANLAESHSAQCSWYSSSIVDLTLAGSTLRLWAHADRVEASENGEAEEVMHTEGEVNAYVLGWLNAAR